MKFVNQEFLVKYLNECSGNLAIGGRDPLLIFIKSSQGTLCFATPGKKIICSIATGIFDSLLFIRYVYCLNSGENSTIFLVLCFKNQEEKILYIGRDDIGIDCLTVFAIIPAFCEGKTALAEYTIQTNFLGKPYYTQAFVHCDNSKQYLKNTLRLLAGLTNFNQGGEVQAIVRTLELQPPEVTVEDKEVDTNAKKYENCPSTHSDK